MSSQSGNDIDLPQQQSQQQLPTMEMLFAEIDRLNALVKQQQEQITQYEYRDQYRLQHIERLEGQLQKAIVRRRYL